MPHRGWIRIIMTTGVIIYSLVIMSPVVSAHEPSQSESAIQNDIVKKQLELIDTDSIEQFWQDIYEKYNGFLPGNDYPSLFDVVLNANGGINLKGMLSGFIHYFFHEFVQNGKLLGTIALLTVFCSILHQMQTAFEYQTVSKVAYAIAYLVLIILAINSFSIALEAAKSAINSMVHFMLALVPLVLTILGAMGNVTTVAIFHPIIVFLVHIIGTAIYSVVFPLLFISVVLGIVSSYAHQYPLTKLAKLMRNVSVSALGIFLTVFLGVVSAQGAMTAVTDGVAIRTAKYVTGNFVPVIGGLFADAADTVVGASLLVKNAIGLSGVIILLFISAFPALKILTLAFIYSITGAVMQPLGDNPIIHCLDEIAKGLMLIFAAMATVGLMFFIALTILVVAGNMSVMLR